MLSDYEAVEAVWSWAASAAVIDRVVEAPRLIHGDLSVAQVFVTPDGYRVIDWQRPMIAPPEVDLVTLLVNQKVEPWQ